jgi:hypothetical protein
METPTNNLETTILGICLIGQEGITMGLRRIESEERSDDRSMNVSGMGP